MEKINIVLFTIQLIIIFSLLFVIIFLLKYYSALQLEKRISKYTVDKENKKDLSFFDKYHQIYLKCEHKLALLLAKLYIFNTYSKKYDQYVDKSKDTRQYGMDFIAMKVVYGFIVLIIVIVSDVLQYKSITFFQIIYSLLIGFFVPDIYLKSLELYRKKRIENDLLRAITMMNNAFQSGKSTMQALSLVSKELDGPLQEEFKKMCIDLSYGLSLE
ncbi:MAG: hypothetical protein RSD40_05825, partial [Bacilli bacterium]